MKKLYFVLSLFLALSGLTAVHAQDSSVCNAAFQATVSGNTVFFRAMDSLPGVRHNWNFGDGSTASTDSFVVNHTYPVYGQYVVTQIVIVSETSDTLHHQYTFAANVYTSIGGADTVRWTINDTLVGTGDTLLRTLVGGPYNVCALLTVGSCQSQSCVTINPQDSVPTTPPPPPDTCTIGFTATPRNH